MPPKIGISLIGKGKASSSTTSGSGVPMPGSSSSNSNSNSSRIRATSPTKKPTSTSARMGADVSGEKEEGEEDEEADAMDILAAAASTSTSSSSHAKGRSATSGTASGFSIKGAASKPAAATVSTTNGISSVSAPYQQQDSPPVATPSTSGLTIKGRSGSGGNGTDFANASTSASTSIPASATTTAASKPKPRVGIALPFKPKASVQPPPPTSMPPPPPPKLVDETAYEPLPPAPPALEASTSHAASAPLDIDAEDGEMPEEGEEPEDGEAVEDDRRHAKFGGGDSRSLGGTTSGGYRSPGSRSAYEDDGYPRSSRKNSHKRSRREDHHSRRRSRSADRDRQYKTGRNGSRQRRYDDSDSYDSYLSSDEEADRRAARRNGTQSPVKKSEGVGADGRSRKKSRSRSRSNTRSKSRSRSRSRSRSPRDRARDSHKDKRHSRRVRDRSRERDRIRYDYDDRDRDRYSRRDRWHDRERDSYRDSDRDRQRVRDRDRDRDRERDKRDIWQRGDSLSPGHSSHQQYQSSSAWSPAHRGGSRQDYRSSPGYGRSRHVDNELATDSHQYSHSSKGNAWEVQQDPLWPTSKYDTTTANFHDEPGAPRHPSRDLAKQIPLNPASTSNSTWGTPSAPPPPLASANKHSGWNHSLPPKPTFATNGSIKHHDARQSNNDRDEGGDGWGQARSTSNGQGKKEGKIRDERDQQQQQQEQNREPLKPPIATPFFLPTPPASDSAEGQNNLLESADDGWGKVPTAALPSHASWSSPPPSLAVPEDKVQARTFTLFGSSSLDDYQLADKIGEGTFGVVHKAVRRAGTVRIINEEESTRRRSGRRRGNDNVERKSKVKEGDVVALKKIVMHNDLDGVPITALREIRLLKSLDHPNVVPVIDMAFQPGSLSDLRRGTIYMVFPYMAHDLAGLLENRKISSFSQQTLKLYAKQLLEGTSYLHRNRILHRDMKAANLLVSDDGTLQIADFGLARSIEDRRPDQDKREYTNCVVTRWYRPPELLLGLRTYGPAIDMWGVGCVIGEMFMRQPVFTGSSDLDQLHRIVNMCGPISESTLPGWAAMPDSGNITFPPSTSGRSVQRDFVRFDENLADLMDKLLTLDPERRMTADEALDHEWFWTDPLPAEVGTVKAMPSSHEYDKRKVQENAVGGVAAAEKNRKAQEEAFRGPNMLVKVQQQQQQQAQGVQQQHHPQAAVVHQHRGPQQPLSSGWPSARPMQPVPSMAAPAANVPPQAILQQQLQHQQQVLQHQQQVQMQMQMQMQSRPGYQQQNYPSSFSSLNGNYGQPARPAFQQHTYPQQQQQQSHSQLPAPSHPSLPPRPIGLPPRPSAAMPPVSIVGRASAASSAAAPLHSASASSWDSPSGNSQQTRRSYGGSGVAMPGRPKAVQQHADYMGGEGYNNANENYKRDLTNNVYTDLDKPAGDSEPGW